MGDWCVVPFSAVIVGSSNGFNCVDPDMNRLGLPFCVCLIVAFSSSGENGSENLQAEGLTGFGETRVDLLELAAVGDLT